MRKSFVYSITLLFVLNVTAQNWDLFLPGQTAYYAQYISDGVKVESFYTDTSGFVPGDAFFSPNLCPDNELWVRAILYENAGHLLNEDKVELQSSDKNLVYFNSPWNTNFETDWSFSFPKDLKPGQTADGFPVRIKCISEFETTVLGSPDTIRYFQCLTPPFNHIEFVLSQHHGFVQFPPMRIFSLDDPSDEDWQYFHLIGIGDSSHTSGYVQPGFRDYFHLQPGDVLYWHETDFAPPSDYDIAYFRDSIVSNYISDDSVAYVFYSTRFDHTGKEQETLLDTMFHLNRFEGRILSGSLSWFGRLNNMADDLLYFLGSLHLDILGTDTLSRLSYNYSAHRIENCYTSGAIDATEYVYEYSSLTGLYSIQSYGWGANYQKRIIGSVINGMPNGVVQIPTGLKNATEHSVQIFPNPVTDILNIDSDGEKIMSYQLFDLNGKLIFSDRFDVSIDLGRITDGLYMLQLLDVDLVPISLSKIVKQ